MTAGDPTAKIAASQPCPDTGAVAQAMNPTRAQARALRRIRRAVHHAAKLGTYPPLVSYAVLDGQTTRERHDRW